MNQQYGCQDISNLLMFPNFQKIKKLIWFEILVVQY